MLSELHNAIKTGQTDKAIELATAQPALLDMPYPEMLDILQGTPLHQAFESGNRPLLTALLRLHPESPNSINKAGKTPLALFKPGDDYQENLPFFEAVNAGCLIDPNNIRTTNDLAVSVLDSILTADEKGSEQQEVAKRFLNQLGAELKEYAIVQQLPNPNRNPKAFCGYILSAAAAEEIACSVEEYTPSRVELPTLILEVMDKQGRNWEKNLHDLLKENLDPSIIEDTVKEYVRHVMLANAVRKSLGAVPKEELDFIHLDEDDFFNILRSGDAARPIVENRSISEIAQVAKAYHEQRRALMNQLIEIDADMIADAAQKAAQKQREIAARHDWLPLLANHTVLEVPKEALGEYYLPNGARAIHLHELTTRKALKEEGDTQDHCVGSYGNDCRNNKSRIFSIRTDKGDILSTLEIEIEDDKLKFGQNRGYENKEPPVICERAKDWLKRSLHDGTVQRHKMMAADQANQTVKSPVPDFILDIGYVPTLAKCERALELFKAVKTKNGKPFLAPAYRNMTVEDIDQAIGFTKLYRDKTYTSHKWEIGEHQLARYEREVAKIKNALLELPGH